MAVEVQEIETMMTEGGSCLKKDQKGLEAA